MSELTPFRIRKIREFWDLSQQELADLCGLPQHRIASMEDGALLPNSNDLCALVPKLRVSADYLLGLSDIPNPAPGRLSRQEAEAMARAMETMLEVLRENPLEALSEDTQQPDGN